MKTVKLSDVCIKITDGSHNPPKSDEHGTYMMLSSKNVFDDSINFGLPRMLSKQKFDLENKRTDIQTGDVLLTIVGTIGRSAVVTKDMPKFTLQRSVAVLRPDTNTLNPRYLMLILRSKLDDIRSQAQGTAQKGIYLNQIKNIIIKLSTLEEQRQLVEQLDAAFEKIDQAIKLTEKNILNTKNFRAQVIDYAMKKSGGKKIILEDFCSFENGDRGKNYPSKSKQISSGIPFINAGNLNRAGLNFTNMAYISEETYAKLGAGKIKTNDILFCLRGSLGKFGSVGNLNLGAIASSLVIIRPDQKRANPEYLLYYFEGVESKKMIDKFENGTAQPNLSATNVKKFEINLPTIEMQIITIATLNKQTNAIDQLKHLYETKKLLLLKFKQSLLNQAFSGNNIK